MNKNESRAPSISIEFSREHIFHSADVLCFDNGELSMCVACTLMFDVALEK
jgi:hypothetical protein